MLLGPLLMRLLPSARLGRAHVCVELALALLHLLLMVWLLLRATEEMGRRSLSPLGSPARSSLAPLALLLVLPLLQLLAVSSHACRAPMMSARAPALCLARRLLSASVGMGRRSLSSLGSPAHSGIAPLALLLVLPLLQPQLLAVSSHAC